MKQPHVVTGGFFHWPNVDPHVVTEGVLPERTPVGTGKQSKNPGEDKHPTRNRERGVFWGFTVFYSNFSVFLDSHGVFFGSTGLFFKRLARCSIILEEFLKFQYFVFAKKQGTSRENQYFSCVCLFGSLICAVFPLMKTTAELLIV